MFTHVNLIVSSMSDLPGWLRDLADEANNLVITHGVIIRAKLVTNNTAMLTLSPWRENIDYGLVRSRLTLLCNKHFVRENHFLFYSFAHREQVLQDA